MELCPTEKASGYAPLNLHSNQEHGDYGVPNHRLHQKANLLHREKQRIEKHVITDFCEA